MKMTTTEITDRILKLNGFAFISFKAIYDIPTSILKKGSKSSQATLLNQGIDRSKMFRKVTTQACLATTKRGYNEYVQKEFDKAGLPEGFAEWKQGQVEKYGEKFNGNYKRNDDNNAALEIGKNETQHLVIFRAKNLETVYYYIDEATGNECEIKLNDSRLDNFHPKKSERYADYTEYEKMVRSVRDRIAIRKPKIENIISIKIIGEEIELVKAMAFITATTIIDDIKAQVKDEVAQKKTKVKELDLKHMEYHLEDS